MNNQVQIIQKLYNKLPEPLNDRNRKIAGVIEVILILKKQKQQNPEFIQSEPSEKMQDLFKTYKELLVKIPTITEEKQVPFILNEVSLASGCLINAVQNNPILETDYTDLLGSIIDCLKQPIKYDLLWTQLLGQFKNILNITPYFYIPTLNTQFKGPNQNYRFFEYDTVAKQNPPKKRKYTSENLNQDDTKIRTAMDFTQKCIHSGLCYEISLTKSQRTVLESGDLCFVYCLRKEEVEGEENFRKIKLDSKNCKHCFSDDQGAVYVIKVPPHRFHPSNERRYPYGCIAHISADKVLFKSEWFLFLGKKRANQDKDLRQHRSFKTPLKLPTDMPNPKDKKEKQELQQSLDERLKNYLSSQQNALIYRNKK